MKYLLLIAAVYVAAVIETSLVDVIRVGHVTPDLLAMTAMVWGLISAGPVFVMGMGAIGLLVDLTAPGRVGLGVMGMLLVGCLLEWLRPRIRFDHLPIQLAMVWVGAPVLALTQTIGHWALGELGASLPVFLGRASGVGLYTAAVSLPVLMILGWVRESSRIRRRKLAEF